MTVIVFTLRMVILVLTLHLIHCQELELNNKCSYSANREIFMCTGLITKSPSFNGFIKPETKILVLAESENMVLTEANQDETISIMSYTIRDIDELDISSFAFQNLFDLNFLRITNTGWDYVRNNTFVGLENLEILDIQNNNISAIEPKAFAGLFSLTVLELNGNHLKTLFSYMFEDIGNVEQLFLEDNLIESIEARAFYGLGALYSLNLSGNKLKVIQTVRFNMLPDLKYFYINFNKIDDIIGSFSLPNLILFNASNNMISHISENVFRGAPRLQEIDLSANLLRHLTEEPFLHLHFLGHLNIKNNGADRMYFVILKNSTDITF